LRQFSFKPANISVPENNPATESDRPKLIKGNKINQQDKQTQQQNNQAPIPATRVHNKASKTDHQEKPLQQKYQNSTSSRYQNWLGLTSLVPGGTSVPRFKQQSTQQYQATSNMENGVGLPLTQK
jgi:hypothetical protein